MLSIISLLFCLPALVFHRAPRRTPILRIYILSVRLQSRICRMEACARARCCKNLTIFIVYPFLCCDISTVCRLMVHHHFRLKENKKHTRKRVNCFFFVCASFRIIWTWVQWLFIILNIIILYWETKKNNLSC